MCNMNSWRSTLICTAMEWNNGRPVAWSTITRGQRQSPDRSLYSLIYLLKLRRQCRKKRINETRHRRLRLPSGVHGWNCESQLFRSKWRTASSKYNNSLLWNLSANPAFQTFARSGVVEDFFGGGGGATVGFSRDGQPWPTSLTNSKLTEKIFSTEKLHKKISNFKIPTTTMDVHLNSRRHNLNALKEYNLK